MLHISLPEPLVAQLVLLSHVSGKTPVEHAIEMVTEGVAELEEQVEVNYRLMHPQQSISTQEVRALLGLDN